MKTPSRADALAVVCREHFPEADPARVEEEAVGADWLVRREIEGFRVRKMRRGRSPEVSFAGTANRADVLRRARDAIDRKDAWAWKKAVSERDEQTSEIYEEALAAVTGGEPWMHTLGENATDVLGPRPECIASDPEHWRVRRAALQLALGDKRLKGRPPAANRDEALRVLVGLWECLSGQSATQPGRTAGASERTGALVEFITAAAGIYEAEGLHHAVPRNSGAAWVRILTR